jgi:hypothetical protein
VTRPVPPLLTPYGLRTLLLALRCPPTSGLRLVAARTIEHLLARLEEREAP